jgi:hypothetical protein
MRESTSGEKQLLSVYINKSLIDRIKADATRQHRKISGQIEMMLAAATEGYGDNIDTEKIQTNGAGNKRIIGAEPLPRPQDSR